MGFFWKKPQGGNMQTQSKHLTNSCILDELGTNKHTLFDACLVIPLWSLANYCMNFILTVLHTFLRPNVAENQGSLPLACIPVLRRVDKQ